MNVMASWTRRDIGGIRWQIDPGYVELLCGPDGLLRDGPARSECVRLLERLQSWQASIVKQGAHRTVYRVESPRLACYIKHNRVADARSWLRELLRGCKSVNECRKVLEIADRGVPTARPIAVGRASGGLIPGESYLITQALENVETLRTVIETRLPSLRAGDATRLRRSLVQALAELLATLHDAGVRHHDLHAANFLVRLDVDRPRLYLIDLHAVDLGPPLDWTQSRDNLIVLHGWAVLRVPRSERLRFWKAYWEARTHVPGAITSSPRPRTRRLTQVESAENLAPWPLVRVLTDDVEQRTWQSNYRFWQRRDRRCRRNNRYYRRVRGACAVGHAVSDLDRDIVSRLLADPDAPFREEGARLLKDGLTSTVVELAVKIGGVERALVYKRFFMPKWHAPLANLVRPSPALRSWVAGHALIDRTVPTPRPLLMLQRRRLGLCREGYLLTEKVDGVNLHETLRQIDRLVRQQRRATLQQYIDEVARTIARLHRCGVSHRDLKADNVLVTEPRLGQAVACWLIDLVGVTRTGHLSHGRRVQNLARLNASFHQSAVLSRSDRLRFLMTYLHSRAAGRDNWRTWWLDITQATLGKVAHNRRKGRAVG